LEEIDVALIRVEQIKKATVTVQMEKSVATTKDKYAAFFHASADGVINKANNKG
jgi:hypothetical protein